MNKIPLDKRVWPGVVLLGLLMIVQLFLAIPFATPILMVLFFAHLLFFRDLEPQALHEEGLLSPADGKVVEISEIFEDKFLHEQAVRIRIFLSIFNVHVTRSPFSGIVKYQQYVRGKFLNALRKMSFEHNESNWIGIENHERRVLIRQMSGAIARRIYSDVVVGQVVGRGEKLGMICYGSGVEMFVAKRFFEPSIQVGQHVSVGATLLGQWIREA
ncbi:MAG TPA: phosphatidylserine decarboxylase [Candidatus Omnitrophota bacterium]|nr:phosphatidylserine decarboxylase [Candidatus Omnitrophota bacterium]